MSAQGLPIVAILGDSRVFDTYFTNPNYRERYGYDATFPHVLRKAALLSPEPKYDVVHIPEHFRGGTVENNIIRLALTDPAVVVLCDGIWETLVHKKWFTEWADEKVRSRSASTQEPLDLTYSSRRLADLFIANELSVSPRSYALKQRRIISYFRRRRRQCVWLSLPMPPREHLNRLHYAGNFLCIPEWDECLRAINDAMSPLVSAYGAAWVDLHDLALRHGGFGQALIDQWHFSASFHSEIAADLAHRLPSLVDEGRVPAEHASRRFLLAREPETEVIALYGSMAAVDRWREDNPNTKISAVLVDSEDSQSTHGLPNLPLSKAAKLTANCVLALEPTEISPEAEARLLTLLPQRSILLYPDELRPLDNPAGADRAMHGKLQ